MVRLLGVVIFIALLFTVTAEASEKDGKILFGGVSHHFISEETTNNFHRAFIVGYKDYLVGYVRNSYDQDSFVGAYKIYEEIKQDYDFDVYLGAVKGYDKCYGAFENDEQGKDKVLACPLVVVNVTIKTDTYVRPIISLWGDAIVLTGRIDF